MITSHAAVPPLPDETAHLANVAFGEGNPYRAIGDHLDEVFDDADFSGLYAASEETVPASLLAMVTIFQFVEGLSDLEAVAALRSRVDWKYALHLPLSYEGFDELALSEFRQRVAYQKRGQLALKRLLHSVRELGLAWQ